MSAELTIRQPAWRDMVTRNLSERTKPVKWIIVHATEGREPGDLATLLGQTKKKVSADFYVTRDGRIFKLNPQLSQFYTWHAGKSFFLGLWDINRVSIGIEQEHKGDEDWPDAQIEATAYLCAWLVRRFKLKLEDGPIQSHRAVAWLRGRKSDPKDFPWARLGQKVRLWFNPPAAP